MSAPRHFEDFHVGQKFAFGHYTVTKDEIVAFAREFDPQPQHLDEELAKQTILGGLCASGWHICAIAMRMVVDHQFGDAEARGGAGVDECRWLKPVRPGDVLRMEVEVLEMTAHPRRNVGFVKTRWDIFNQRELVCQVVTTPLFERRAA